MPYSVSVPITRRTLMKCLPLAPGAPSARSPLQPNAGTDEGDMLTRSFPPGGRPPRSPPRCPSRGDPAPRTPLGRDPSPQTPLGGLSANSHQRYCPVLATVSIDRPASVPVLPETRVLM